MLFGPNWKTKDKSKINQVIKGLDKISNQNKLYEISVYAPLSEVREKAIEKITDDNLLKDRVIKHIYEDTQYLALEKIKNEKLLVDIINNQNILPLEIKNKAIERMKDKNIIEQLAKELPTTHRLYEEIYKKLDNPPFEISIQLHSKEAEENIIKDLNNMKYPEDRDKILSVINKKNMNEAINKALELLPMKEEKETLEKIYKESKFLTTKLSIIKKMNFKENKEFLENILREGDINNGIIKIVASKLDKNSPLLEKEVCPKCGAMDSMHLFDEYRRSIDLNVRGYCCSKCNYESLEQTGLGEVKNPKITLRDFIKI